ncbi:MAG: sugar ABC transporter ATP-binding protein [Eubacteriales bacterium]|nr:sugar ABC transporter ATP-binding protein [Eubacteriales bacterium]
MEKLIEFSHISKFFPGTQALKDVSFSINRGEIHAIIGENGAGKSTLLNILHGVFLPSEGEVRIEGKSVRFRDIHMAKAAGIVKVHQELSILPERTVAENMFLGEEPGHCGIVNHKLMNEKTTEMLKRLKCNFKATDVMGSLMTGQKQMVTIAKAIESNARLISFDEPTASLSDVEVALLFKMIRELQSRGITILYISHKMDEIFELCSRATVMRDGAYIGTYELAKTSRDEIIRAMVGRDVSMFARRTLPCQASSERVLEVEHVSGSKFHDCSFYLRKGELLGFFGLVGAGRSELMRGIFGADPIDGGEIRLNGTSLRFRNPSQAVQAGFGLITENRKEEGIIPNLDNLSNISISCLKQFVRAGFLDHKAQVENAKRRGAEVGLTPNDPFFPTSGLSGGNAQKVMLARWLSTEAPVLVFDEPTKGIDIGAKAEIYALMESMLKKGISIIMVSSELTEVIGMSDRIYVMRDGVISADVLREDAREDLLLAHAMEDEE